MVDGVSVNEVLQKSGELYNLEIRFRNKPLSDWFYHILPAIELKLNRTKFTSIINTFIEFRDTIDDINERVRDIGKSIVQALPKGENLRRDRLEALIESNNQYIKLVYEEFGHMILAMNTFIISAETCEKRFRSQIYNGKEGEILGEIWNLINYTPRRTVPGNKVMKCRDFALDPLQKLPPTNGPVYEDFLTCVKEHYTIYQQIRSEGHERIEQMEKEIFMIDMGDL